MLPIFYSEQLVAEKNEEIILDEDTSRHIVQVLRMKTGDGLQLTNGKGSLCTAEIINDNKKKVQVSITESANVEAPRKSICICLSLLKNANRFEWFLEKATELGITELIPLICERTERQHFRASRMKSILISAMLQSRQCWLPVLREPTMLKDVIEESYHEQKFIAHCIEETKTDLAQSLNKRTHSYIILVGPEGDFTPDEISSALQNGFIATSLGNTRLRSETAAMVAAAILQLT